MRWKRYLKSVESPFNRKHATRWFNAAGNNSRCNNPTRPTLPVSETSKSFSFNIYR